jgi:hypothetical protein
MGGPYFDESISLDVVDGFGVSGRHQWPSMVVWLSGFGFE